VEPEENERRVRAGLKPKARPVNNGQQFTKRATHLATRTDSGKRVKRGLQPIQLGLGAKAGPEKMVFTARAMLKTKHIAAAEDGENGFNATKRQALLDGTKEMWPEGMAMVNALYGDPSIVLYVYRNDEGKTKVRVILGKEGTRMGCPIGSMGFDIAEHVFIFDALRKEFPMVTMRALTDDLCPFFTEPPPGKDWEDQYDLVVRFWDRYDQLANPIGIFRNKEKSTMVIPHGAKDPSTVPRGAKGTVLWPVDSPDPEPAGVPITRWNRVGYVVGGGAVGVDSPEGERFMADHAMGKLPAIEKKMEKILTLAENEPMMAIKLIGTVTNAALDYYARVTPTRHMAKAAAEFDEIVERGRLRALSPEQGTKPKYSAERGLLATAVAQTPTRHGGWGHTPLVVRAPSGSLAALMSIADDPLLQGMRSEFKTEATNGSGKVCELLGVDSVRAGHPAAKVLPDDPNKIIEGPFALTLNKENKKVRPQALMVGLIMDQVRLKSRADVFDAVKNKGMSKADAVHYWAITARSRLGRVMSCSQWHKYNRIEAADFIPWARWYLGLPQLLIWGEPEVPKGLEAECDRCRVAHAKVGILEPTGNHVACCISSYKARYATHTGMEYDIIEGATLAGVQSVREPPTDQLVGDGHTPEIAKLKWPKTSNAKEREAADELQMAMDELSKCAPEDKEEWEKFIATTKKKLPKDVQSLRIDVSLLSVDNREKWTDVSGIHLTSKTRLDDQFNFYAKEVAVEQLLRKKGLAMPNYKESSTPAVRLAQADKHKKYRPMLRTAQMQFANKRRPTNPDFWGCIAAHEGEWSTNLIDMIEFLAMSRFGAVQRAPRRRDGVKPSGASAEVRAMMRDRFAITLARGWGKQLRSGGFPRRVQDEDIFPNDDGFY
jgi:hypothetical protein